MTSKELKLPWLKWGAWLKANRDKLDDHDRLWLYTWEMWDLACSPMDDNERRFIRYGHYLGWTDCEDKDHADD